MDFVSKDSWSFAMMWVWVILIILLILVAGAMSGLTWFNVTRNLSSSVQNRLFSFAATIGPSGADANFVDSSGQPQISCPAGYTVNIVGALASPIDPDGTCSLNGPTVPLQVACGATKTSPFPTPVAGNTCSSDLDCAGGGIFECKSGKCQLRNDMTSDDECAKNAQVPGSFACITSTGQPCTSGIPGMCIDRNLCLGITYSGNDSSCSQGTTTPTGWENPVCSSGGSGSCTTRDASAYVAAKCDGTSTCPLSTVDFGPLPCRLTPPSGGCNINPGTGSNAAVSDWSCARINNDFCSLPFAYGFPGGVPIVNGQQTQGNSQPGSVSLGYRLSGIYTCIPTLTSPS